MKNIILLLTVLFSIQAQAHVEPGKYVGASADGTACAMVAGETYFEGGAAHPLNERIKIAIGNEIVIVGHPPVVSSAQSMAYFNHDIFQGVIPHGKGAKAIIINMIHEEGKEGPASFELIDHAWKTNEKSHIKCMKLVHQK
ncbi:MAG: hypothetical protein ABL958_15355 [Bdellovibrionia bacterium]